MEMENALDTFNMSDQDPLIDTNNASDQISNPVVPQEVHHNYKIRNLASFSFTGFFCVAFVIFLTSSQPFYIDQVLNIDNHEIGKIIGTLGVFDEITSIILSPLLGSLNDKLAIINFAAGSTKFIVFGGFVSIFTSFYLYGLVSYTHWAQLIIPRCIFAFGVTATMSMIPVMLNQLIYSDFNFSNIFFWRKVEPLNGTNVSKSGKYSALIGVSTGIGAVFSVSVFLSLPVKLLADYDLSSRDAMKTAFVILGSLSFLVSLIMLRYIYNPVVRPDHLLRKPSYLKLLETGFSKVREDATVRIACLGGLVARSTSVLIAVFIPLYVYNFYFESGLCDNDGTPAKTNCYDGYTFAAILTGVAQTMSLISSPLWGILADKIGKKHTLIVSAFVGALGNWLICIFRIHDPRNALTFILVSVIGISQIGTVITSMSMISAENDAVGSISGIYSLFGGAGILLLSQIGGIWSDHWVFAPFFLVGFFDISVVVSGFIEKRRMGL